MSVRSALCLLVVLICYREISAQGGIGSICADNAGCSSVNFTICRSQVCVCIDTHVPDFGNAACIPKVGFGNACNESIQCIDLGEAECISNTCQCRSGFNFNGFRCTGNIGLGQPCQRDIECSVPNDPRQETVFCLNGQCGCTPGYMRQDDRCVIGGDCTSDADCRNLTNSFCDRLARDRFRCACSQNFLALSNNTRCLPVATGLGNGCELNEQCTHRLQNTVCTNYQCACAPGTTLQGDNTCAFRGDCTTDQDCSPLENSYCDKQHCACKDDFILVGNNTKCLPIATSLGVGCEYNEQCTAKLGNAVCANNQCRCAEGATRQNDNTCGAAVRIVLSLSCFVLVLMAKLL